MSEPSPLTIGDFVYSQDSRISIRRVVKQNEWNLVIKDVRPADAGVYECAVSSREKIKRLVLLRVTGKYKVLILIINKNISYHGDFITFCENPNLKYSVDKKTHHCTFN